MVLPSILCFKSLARHASKIQELIHSLRLNEVAAMVDCIAGLTDLVQKLQMSTKVMDEGGKDNDVVRVGDSNDVFQVKKGIKKGIVNFAHLTSNALAFVENFALAHNN
ncbi:hypothetical protein E1A91_A09G207800v1 [Gossypium mustelinum]|uniref:Pectinesterase inhibitor domain-containing protein n=1 Tax=Gossypium mustelinum TaxID=34275 RepID=A0A5D2Y0M5_GOSMU|nr:hypothetical protein E1A91_A09G207800v1 [Gossypium mustelinum]